MTDKTVEKPGAMEARAGASARSHAGNGAVGVGPVKRFPAQWMLAAVQRFLRGEALETVSGD